MDDEELGFVGEVTGVTSLVAKMKVAFFLVTNKRHLPNKWVLVGKKHVIFFCQT